jgi:hypothetical protein
MAELRKFGSIGARKFAGVEKGNKKNIRKIALEIAFGSVRYCTVRFAI